MTNMKTNSMVKNYVKQKKKSTISTNNSKTISILLNKMVMIPTCTVTAVALFISIMMLVIVIAEKYAINYDKMNIEEKFQELYASNNGENQQTPTNTDIDTIDRPLLCDQIRQLLLQDDKNLQQILPPRNTPPLGEIPSPLPNIPQHPKNPRQPPPSHPHAPSMSTETYYFKNIFFTNSNMIIEIDVPLMSCQKTIDLQDPEFYILNLPTNPNTYFILSSSSNKLCVTPKSKNLYFYAYVDTIPDETEENRHV